MWTARGRASRTARWPAGHCDVGHRGLCVLEIFSDNVPDSLYETDLDDLLRTNRTALASAWRNG